MNLDATRFARRIKIMSHQYLCEYEYTLFIDGNIQILKNLEGYILKYINLDFKLGMIKHPWGNNCLYKEGMGCIDWGKDTSEKILPQLEKYRELGIPENLGMVESNIIFRNNNDPKIQFLMEEWWKEVLNHSKRDQISFNYVMYKNNHKYELLEGHSRGGSDFFFAVPHKENNEKENIYMELIDIIMYQLDDKTLFKREIYIFGLAKMGRFLNMCLQGKGFNVRGFLAFETQDYITQDSTEIYYEQKIINIKNSLVIVSVEGSHQAEIIEKLKAMVGSGVEVISWRTLLYPNINIK